MWCAPSLVEVEVVVYSLLVRWSWSWYLYPSSVEVDSVCIASVEVVLVVLVEFGTPVFSRPFVLPRWRLYWWSLVLRSSVDHLYCLGGGCIG